MRGRTDAIDTHPRRFRRITRVCGTLAANSGEVRQISVEASVYPSMLGAGKGRLDRGRSPDETPSAPEAAGARGEWVARVAVHVRNIALLRTPSVPISNCKSPNLDAQRLASATPHPVPWGRGDALQSLLRSFWRAWRRSVPPYGFDGVSHFSTAGAQCATNPCNPAQPSWKCIYGICTSCRPKR